MKSLIDANQNNPFPGLRPFEMEEYHLFFGRDGQSDELLKRLRLTRFVAVVGTSGSGKSSLIRAGLLPALHGGLMAGAGSAWRVVLMRPGHDPIGNLAYEMGAAGALSEDNLDLETQNTLIETVLRRSTIGLVEVVRQTRSLTHENLLIVVDQFEELFRFKEASNQTQSTDDAAQFVKLLIAASAQVEIPIYVVLTMRSDFLGDCSQFAGLPEAINRAQYLIPRMSRDERHAAVTGPISVGGGEITQPLVNRLLNDVGDNPDQLPILQHALMRTWNYWANHRQNDDDIGLEDYEAIGTMTEALSRHADEACAELPNERSRGIAERLFKLLTEKGDDNREIRRPTRLADICAVAQATPAEVTAVVNVFRSKGRSFLMPPEGIELTPDTVIDISHESLIRNWQVLKRWTTEEADSGRMYRRLADALKDFGDSPLPNTLLDTAIEWRQRCKPNAAWAARYRRASEQEPSFDEVISFIERSQAARQARIEEEKTRAEEELARQRRELENAAALAEKELRLAETERERAEDRALANQRELEQAQVFAKKQASAARRFRFLAVALGAMLLVAFVAVLFTIKAQAEARDNANKAIAAAEEAQKAKAQADLLRSAATENAEQLKLANIDLEAARKKSEAALVVAQDAEAAARAKEAEVVGLRNKELKARVANEYFRNGFTAPNSEQASKAFQEAAKKFEELEDFIAAGASYLQSAKGGDNPFETPNEQQIISGFDGAVESFRKAARKAETKDAVKDAQTREAVALVEKGEYLTKKAFDSEPTNPERLNQGIQSLEAGLKIYQASGNLDGTISTLQIIAKNWRANGQAQKAIDSIKQTVPLYKTKKDWPGLREVLFSLALQDETNRARYLDEVLATAKESNDFKARAETLAQLAAFYLDHHKNDSDVKKGIELFDQALKAYKDGGADKEAAALLINMSGRIRSSSEAADKDRWIDYLKQALDIYLKLPDAVTLRETLSPFLSDAKVLKQWPDLFVYAERTLDLLEPKAKGAFLLEIASAQTSVNQPLQAFDAYKRALAFFKAPEERSSLASTLIEMGKIQIELKQLPDALKSFTDASETYHSLNQSKLDFDFYSEEASALSNIGFLQETLGQPREAVVSYTKARDLYKKASFGESEASDMETRIKEIQKRLVSILLVAIDLTFTIQKNDKDDGSVIIADTTLDGKLIASGSYGEDVTWKATTKKDFTQTVSPPVPAGDCKHLVFTLKNQRKEPGDDTWLMQVIATLKFSDGSTARNVFENMSLEKGSPFTTSFNCTATSAAP